MPTTPAVTTVPGAADTRNATTRPLVLALVITYSRTQPERVGEVAFCPYDLTLILGRGADKPEILLRFFRQCPGENATQAALNPLEGESISRDQLTIRATAVSLIVEQLGGCVTLVNGKVQRAAILKPGDTILLKNELGLLCVLRPETLPAMPDGYEMHAYGGPDALGSVGEGPAAWALRAEAWRAAREGAHTLIQGERGSGKEFTARGIHKLSRRAGGPFLACNAKSITPTLIEAELFGNLKNYPAGTPARDGLFRTAHGGTLFLDEIGELSFEAQAQLLRALQEGEYMTVGESIPRRADVLVVAASNRDNSYFKDDVHDRFKSRVMVAPLRERREDIPLLIRHLMHLRAAKFPEDRRFLRMGKDGRLQPVIDGRLVDYLVREPLEGNVRDLDRLLMIAVQQSPGDEIRMPASMLAASLLPAPARPLGERVERVERVGAVEAGEGAPGAVPAGEPSKAEIEAMLDREAGNVASAARKFGIPRPAFYRLLWDLGLKKRGSGDK